jgi:hypothetical protein
VNVYLLLKFPQLFLANISISKFKDAVRYK